MTQLLSKKGQIVIPAKIRAKYHLSPGDPVSVKDLDGGIMVFPLSKDPIRELRGFLKGKGPEGVSLAEDLLIDRRREVENEERRLR
jgi:AbrB family looped-hinge helix DNA binding protein